MSMRGISSLDSMHVNLQKASAVIHAVGAVGTDELDVEQLRYIIGVLADYVDALKADLDAEMGVTNAETP